MNISVMSILLRLLRVGFRRFEIWPADFFAQGANILLALPFKKCSYLAGQRMG